MKGESHSQSPSGKKKLNPKEVLCSEYHPNEKVVEWSLKARNMPGIMATIMNVLSEKGVRFLSGFQTIDPNENIFLLGGFIDLSASKIKSEDVGKLLRAVEGVLEVNVHEEMFDGLIIDELHFPLKVSGERSFTFRVETFGGILKRLYEKFGTGAAVILYEMGMAAGESRAKSAVKKHRTDKLGILKLIMAERSAKGWCLAEVEDFSSKKAVLTVNDLFECMPFKGKQDRAISHFFRGYLAGICQTLFGKEVSVTEVECIAKGDPVCKFNIQVKD
ncbi:MAG: V4R domain-containing protein [Thermoproteota archaeon]